MEIKKLFLALMMIGFMPAWDSVFCGEILQEPNEYYYAIVECDTGKIVKEAGKVSVTERYAPCSTFKIPLALIGYDKGILVDEKNPLIPYDGKKYSAPIKSWKADQTPESWMKNSCVWYSREIVECIGMEKIKKYLADFSYGNQDMSGGNPQAWLGASLKISVEEQISLIRKLVCNTLPVSRDSIDKTRKILWLESFDNGWTFYGKTGTGYNKNMSIGWFVGWLEKDNSTYVVVMFLKNYQKQENSLPAGPAAKDKCRELLQQSGLMR